jgi:hypothetical protein
VEYTRWFVRKSVTPLFSPQDALTYLGEKLHHTVSRCPFDGFNFQVLLRRKAIKPCLALATKLLNGDQQNRAVVGFASSGTPLGLLRRLISVFQHLDELNDLVEQGSMLLRPAVYNEWCILSQRFCTSKSRNVSPSFGGLRSYLDASRHSWFKYCSAKGASLLSTSSCSVEAYERLIVPQACWIKTTSRVL